MADIWKQQALRRAAEFLYYDTLSPDELAERLLDRGFKKDQIKYVTTNIGTYYSALMAEFKKQKRDPKHKHDAADEIFDDINDGSFIDDVDENDSYDEDDDNYDEDDDDYDDDDADGYYEGDDANSYNENEVANGYVVNLGYRWILSIIAKYYSEGYSKDRMYSLVQQSTLWESSDWDGPTKEKLKAKIEELFQMDEGEFISKIYSID